MGKALYIDVCGGVSGDMLAGALLDLGWPLAELERLVAQLGLEGVEVSEVTESHQSIAAKRLLPKVEHHQPHRHLGDILKMLDRLPEPVAASSKRVFQRLAQAEAAVHGVDVQKVHFHEVGAADAIVDVTAFCAGLAWLAVETVICSPLPLGRGFVQCAHGRLPLPAPAVLNLLDGVPVTSWPAEEETVTPTGAALVTTLAQKFGDFPNMRVEKVGIGGGSRQSSHAPNVVRLVLGEVTAPVSADEVVEIVCHLDDQSPEDLPIIYRCLLAAGALDVAATPILMKKGRPGLALTVMSPPELKEELSSLVLKQTTTLGVRMRTWERRCVPRDIISVETPWGPVGVKRAEIGGSLRLHPEADDVARIAEETGLPPSEIRRKIVDLLK